MNDVKEMFPIAIMSFNRPHYLEIVLHSLRIQTVPIRAEEIFLFQDGHRSKTGHDLTDPKLIEYCIKLFEITFPKSKIFISVENLGVARNFARAENYFFKELKKTAAFFFEDDLVLSSHYLKALYALTDIALNEKRIAYVAAYGNHRATLKEQQRAVNKLIPMRHKWGFALTRRQWDAQRELLEPYLEIVARSDYRDRDHNAIRNYFHQLGYGSPGTSQDSMKDVASCVLGTTKVMTFACLGKYIGETGLHSQKQMYDEEKFGATEIYPDEITSFQPLTCSQLNHWVAEDRANGKRALETAMSTFQSSYPYAKVTERINPISHLNHASEQKMAREPVEPMKQESVMAPFSDSTPAADTRAVRLAEAQDQIEKNLDADATLLGNNFARALYRTFLFRDPDPTGLASVNRQLHNGRSFEELMEWCLRSQEFSAKSKQFLETYLGPQTAVNLQHGDRPRFVPLDAPALHIDSEASRSELQELIDRVGDAWNAMGSARPYYSVLTGRAFLPENLNKEAIDRFWESGNKNANTIQSILTKYGFDNTHSKTCVEYGCGIGRVTFPLSKLFMKVYAYDISNTHLEIAKDRCKTDNIEFILCSDTIFRLGLHKCDFFYSNIVFQHNPPPVIRKLIAMALEALKPEGIAIFQVPTYASGYSFHIREYLEHARRHDMEMHVIPQSEVFALIEDADCKVLEVREDGAVGRVGEWISNTFIVRRRATGPDRAVAGC